jgi:hypothetical protein
MPFHLGHIGGSEQMLPDAMRNDDRQWMVYHSMSCLCDECMMLDGAFVEGDMYFGKETELRILTEVANGYMPAVFQPRDGEWIRVEEKSVSPEEKRVVVEESKPQS